MDSSVASPAAINLDAMNRAAARAADPAVRKDLKVLLRFTEIFCRDRRHEERAPFRMRSLDPREVLGREVSLCPSCTKLLAHGASKRIVCPLDPKPKCKHCPTPCYRPGHREAMREVMRHSGMAAIRRGRLDLLWHYFF